MRILNRAPIEIALQAMKRPGGDGAISHAQILERVRTILDQVRTNGDCALLDLTRELDGVAIDSLQICDAEIEAAIMQVKHDLKAALRTARQNIETFHRSQQEMVHKVETMSGVVCWRESRPIDKVGLYIPGGKAPLISTVLMLGVPAQLAGCREVILCAPPDKHGQIHPAIIYAATLCGITKIYRVGGAQAIAAMAYGSESIPKVDKIFGPGNLYVTQAKQLVQTTGTAIDMPAGPSEVLVWADDQANPEFVAADLLAQAEHGPDSQAILICDSKTFAENTQAAMIRQKANLSRQSIIDEALKHSVLLVASQKDAIRLINIYAPEHLIIQRERHHFEPAEILNAGSVFIGPYSPETAGDYASGTNHTLPTNGYARMYSGVSLDSFVKKITFQELNYEGLAGLAPTLQTLADAEQLDAHRMAVDIRLQSADTETFKPT